MFKKKYKILLVFIILFASILRLYSLGSFGAGFFRDEAAMGFNSWSILKTGKDEFGQSFPIIFRSFEVFFMPAYVYLSIPIYAIFGLTEFSARLLSALSGITLVYVTVLISKKLFKSEVVGLSTSFMVAISPWAIFYSRGAFEGNLALLFFAIGFYLWLVYLENKLLKIFIASIVFFVASMYSYQAPRIIAPLFVGISILFQRGWLKKYKTWIVGGVVALILYFPVLALTRFASGNHRALGVSIFAASANPPGYSTQVGSWQNLYLYPREVLSLYLSYFSPENLFWNGDYNLQRNVPNFSVFYIWMTPFLFVSAWGVLRLTNKNLKYLLLWIFLSPIPAALTRDPFHTYRSILLYFPMTLVIAYGIWLSIDRIRHKKIAVVVLSGIALFYLAYFMFSLTSIVPSVYWRYWDYGYREITDFVKTQPGDRRIVIDDPMTEAYIHFLYFGAISLIDYQKSARELVSGKTYYTSSDELRPTKVGRFEFRPVDWPSERGDANTLFIFPADRLFPSEFSGDPSLKLVKTIFAPNGDAAFYLVLNVNK